MSNLDPSPILQTAFGFWSSKVLLSAVELAVFTLLKDRKLTGAELAQEVGMHSGADFQGWCQEAGFQRFEVIHLFGPSSAAIAYK